MALRPLSFHIAASACLLAQPAPHFTVKDAIRAEWARQAPAFSEAEQARLSPDDRARFELTLRRIGQPGAPDLLPPELANPTADLWLARAKAAKTPRERFDALFFLNRFKRAEALVALDGLKPEDAATWPKHLHLEAGIATARLNGAEVGPELQRFLDALQKAGKVDPVRAQAARLRLVMAGKEKELLPALRPGAGSILALMDAWNRAPWDHRVTVQIRLWHEAATYGMPAIPGQSRPPIELSPIGLQTSPLDVVRRGNLLSRIWDGIPAEHGLAPESWPAPMEPYPLPILIHHAAIRPLMPLSTEAPPPHAPEIRDQTEALLQAAALPAIRKVHPAQADRHREILLRSDSPIARAAAIEDLPSAPADLAELTKRVWNDAEFEPQQTLLQSYARWKMTPEDQKAQLQPWLQHPEWACRWEAYQALKKLDPATPWPSAPAPTKEQEAILREAERLAVAGQPVRLRLTFEGRRRIVLRLNPKVAPINVANLVHLARKGFFNGRRVPRVVPDFVVQMGSPYDTMDGGPGYTVRCEDSLEWYGPGSVGMALGGKDTGGSQFFITTNATPHLTGKYTRMGEVEDLDRAMAILDDLELGARIEKVDVLKP
jgi:cyclophilin family peptidyl-prolyl cis-trans isomerase